MIVTNTAARADGSTPTTVSVRFTLAGTDGAAITGYLADKSLVVPVVVITSGAAWSVDLPPNSTITPAGTRWRIEETVDGHRAAAVYANVPTTGGPYQLTAILSPAPAAVLPAGAVAQATLDAAVAAEASTRTAADNLRALLTDARFADQRTPTDASVTDAKVAANAAIAQAKIAGLVAQLEEAVQPTVELDSPGR